MPFSNFPGYLLNKDVLNLADKYKIVLFIYRYKNMSLYYNIKIQTLQYIVFARKALLIQVFFITL